MKKLAIFAFLFAFFASAPTTGHAAFLTGVLKNLDSVGNFFGNSKFSKAKKNIEKKLKKLKAATDEKDEAKIKKIEKKLKKECKKIAKRYCMVTFIGNGTRTYKVLDGKAKVKIERISRGQNYFQEVTISSKDPACKIVAEEKVMKRIAIPAK